jgi:hypothetical protein
MERITDYVSVRDNGRIRPFNEYWTDSSKLSWTEYCNFWGKQIANRWIYNNMVYQVNFKEIGYEWVDLLFDETGFLVLPEVYCSALAKIFNGDLNLRCIMYPIFNVRGLSDNELEKVKNAKIQHYGHWDSRPHFKWQSRNNPKRADGIIEIEGNDGISDCMYFFNAQNGAFVGAEPFNWID